MTALGDRMEPEMLSYEEWLVLAFNEAQISYADSDLPLPKDSEIEPILRQRYADYVQNCTDN